MIIIEIPQGYYRSLTGTPKAEAVAMFDGHGVAFRTPWREFEVAETKSAPWATEWYTVDEAGLLQRHSAQYDSSG